MRRTLRTVVAAVLALAQVGVYAAAAGTLAAQPAGPTSICMLSGNADGAMPMNMADASPAARAACARHCALVREMARRAAGRRATVPTCRGMLMQHAVTAVPIATPPVTRPPIAPAFHVVDVLQDPPIRARTSSPVPVPPPPRG